MRRLRFSMDILGKGIGSSGATGTRVGATHGTSARGWSSRKSSGFGLRGIQWGCVEILLVEIN